MPTITIIGYDINSNCVHCNRKIHDVIVTDRGNYGAQCFSKIITEQVNKDDIRLTALTVRFQEEPAYKCYLNLLKKTIFILK